MSHIISLCMIFCQQAPVVTSSTQLDGREQLAAVANAYKALSEYDVHATFSSEGSVTNPARKADNRRDDVAAIRLAYSRASKIFVALDDNLVISSDGVNLTSVCGSQYTVGPAPRSITANFLKDNPLGYYYAYHGIEQHLSILLSLLSDDAAIEKILSMTGGSIEPVTEQSIKGRKNLLITIRGKTRVTSVLARNKEKNPDVRLFVDAETHLINQIEIDYPIRVISSGDSVQVKTSDNRTISVSKDLSPNGQKITFIVKETSKKRNDKSLFPYLVPEEFIKIEEFKSIFPDN